MRGTKFVYAAAGAAALGGLLFGYDTGVISGAILFIKDDFALSPTMQEVVVSAVLFGAVFGAAVGGYLADRFGRRPMLIASALIFILGAIATAAAQAIAWLIAGRVVVGAAIGVASFTAPLYISEVSPKQIRGSLVSLNQLALTSGIVLAYLVDYALSGVRGWRWMFGLAGVPAVTLLVAMLLLPDSPRWLAKRGRQEEARSVLRRIRATEDVGGELREIQEGLGRQTEELSTLLRPEVRMALLVGVGLAILQQVTGINTVIYYAPTIFQSAGFGAASIAILATVAVGAVNVAFTIVAIFLVDRVGRRPLLLIGVAGMVLSLGMLGLAFQLPGLSGMVGWIAIGSLMVYVASFAVGLGPVFWLLISEIYPLKVRGSAMSIATVANWGANLLVAVTFLTLVQTLGRPDTFWLYALVGAGSWVFVYFLVPETKGRTLEEIEAQWGIGMQPRGHHSEMASDRS